MREGGQGVALGDSRLPRLVHMVGLRRMLRGERLRTDITFLIVFDDGVCETLIDGYILFVRCRFIEHLGFGGVGDGVVQARPEYLVVFSDGRYDTGKKTHLMTELVVAALELGIGNPDRLTIKVGLH